MKHMDSVTAGIFAGMLAALVMASLIINASLHRTQECYVEVSKGRVAIVKVGHRP